MTEAAGTFITDAIKWAREWIRAEDLFLELMRIFGDDEDLAKKKLLAAYYTNIRCVRVPLLMRNSPLQNHRKD